MEFGSSKDSTGKGKNSVNGDGFIDRSKVKILLCDNDATNSEHVLRLLINCSYEVTSVKSARQVIDALNAEGSDIDIILAEVDLPMAKGMKMLKYITRDKDLRRIPVIMMSAKDEVSTVVKCLRLGAADYLVKPLRTNELLNLWTHMWRRRHMLGLAEKNVIVCDIDVVGSDPSDANTTSTTLISDDTDDISRRNANPEIGMLKHHEEVAAAPVASVAAAPPFTTIFGYRPCVPGISDRRTGQCSLGPKKSELRTGESSAFFTYVKSSMLQDDSRDIAHFDGTAVQNLIMEERIHACSEQEGYPAPKSSVQEGYNPAPKSSEEEGCDTRAPKSCEQEGYSTPAPRSCETREQSSPAGDSHVSNRLPDSQSKEQESSHTFFHQRNEPQIDIATYHAHAHASYSYYMHGMMNQAMMPSSPQMYLENFHNVLQNHGNSPLVPQYGHLPHHMPGIGSYPYFPVNMCLQPGQVASPHQWPSYGPSCSPEVKGSGKADRREAALIKFRQKRKERCFDKKIRYVNRKKLAEKRPRLRGQFVRKNGVNVDLNGLPSSGDFDDDEEDDYDVDQASRDSSPEDDAL